jgi:hypothetical protein
MWKAVSPLLLLMLLIGCSGIQTETPLPPTVVTLNPAPTQTLPLPTPTAGPEMPTDVPSVNIIDACAIPVNEISAGSVGGRVILVPDDRVDKQSIYGWTAGAGTQLFLRSPGSRIIWDVLVSPDRGRISYLETARDSSGNFVNEMLLLVTPDGRQEGKIPWNNFDSEHAWLDNENVLGYRRSARGQVPTPLTVVNLQSGETRDLVLAADDVHWYDPIDWGFYSKSRAVYDPTTTRVIYMGVDENGLGLAAVMQDPETGEELGRVVAGGLMPPIWSPDGKLALIRKDLIGETDSEELFTMHMDGSIEQLTHLTDQFRFTEIGSPAWSPDGQKVAFWLNTGTENGKEAPFYELAVLDTTTKVITNYCVRASSDEWLFAPIWSPNGQQVVVTTLDQDNPDHNNVLLLDLTPGRYTNIAKDLNPVGWAETP